MLDILLFIAVIACSAAFLLSAFGRRKTSAESKGSDGERRVAKVIASLDYPAFHDVYLPSTNGTTQIDHIVRVGNSIFVIETKNLSGVLYGKAADRSWRQSFRRGDSRSFLNPLIQNAIHMRAVRTVAGEAADIRQLVVMAGSASFPQGMPAGVIHVSDLKHHLRLAFVDAGRYGSVELPWERLVATIRRTDRRASRNSHADTIRRAMARGSESRTDRRVDPHF